MTMSIVAFTGTDKIDHSCRRAMVSSEISKTERSSLDDAEAIAVMAMVAESLVSITCLHELQTLRF